MADSKEKEFVKELMALCGELRHMKGDKKYNPTRFIQMIMNENPMARIKEMLSPKYTDVSDGWVNLYDRGLLDYSVEFTALHPKWRELFSDEELRAAEERLLQSNFSRADIDAQKAGSYNRKK